MQAAPSPRSLSTSAPRAGATARKPQQPVHTRRPLPGRAPAPPRAVTRHADPETTAPRHSHTQTRAEPFASRAGVWTVLPAVVRSRGEQRREGAHHGSAPTCTVWQGRIQHRAAEGVRIGTSRAVRRCAAASRFAEVRNPACPTRRRAAWPTAAKSTQHNALMASVRGEEPRVCAEKSPSWRQPPSVPAVSRQTKPKENLSIAYDAARVRVASRLATSETLSVRARVRACLSHDAARPTRLRARGATERAWQTADGQKT